MGAPLDVILNPASSAGGDELASRIVDAFARRDVALERDADLSAIVAPHWKRASRRGRDRGRRRDGS